MPIQVNELVIRAVIDSEGGDERSTPSAEGVNKQDIVAECVEQILEILQERQER